MGEAGRGMVLWGEKGVALEAWKTGVVAVVVGGGEVYTESRA